MLSLALALRENNHEFIKINQINLEKNLITLQHRFQNKKSRPGSLISSSTRAKGHSYHIPIMKLSMELVCEGAMKIRTLEKSFKILSRYFDIGTPCRTTISAWSAITGLYIYNSPLEKGDDWVWMIDLSIPMGNKKLCLIIGVRLSSIQNGNFNITYKDTVLIHMSAMEVVNGDIILNLLKRTVMNRGVTPKYIILDGGSDINKGVKDFCAENKNTILINDISHKCANIVKASISSEPDFIEFAKYITTVKNRMKNSSIAFLCPPKQRTKARFMGFRRVTKWSCLMVFDEAIGELEIDDLIKCCEYLGDLDKFSKKIIEWDMVFEFLEQLQKEIKRNGLTRGVNGFNSTSQKLKKMMKENQMLSEYATNIINEVINFVKSEEDKLPDGVVIIATTDILESIIGTWKSTISEDSLCGITSSVLTLPLLTKTLTEDLIKIAMEAVNWDDVNKWAIENIGPSMFSKRLALSKSKTSTTQEEAIAEIFKGVDQVPSIELNDLPERKKCRRWSFSKSSKTTGKKVPAKYGHVYVRTENGD